MWRLAGVTVFSVRLMAWRWRHRALSRRVTHKPLHYSSPAPTIWKTGSLGAPAHRHCSHYSTPSLTLPLSPRLDKEEKEQREREGKKRDRETRMEGKQTGRGNRQEESGKRREGKQRGSLIMTGSCVTLSHVLLYFIVDYISIFVYTLVQNKYIYPRPLSVSLIWFHSEWLN